VESDSAAKTTAVVRLHELCGVQHVADLLGRRGDEPKASSGGSDIDTKSQFLRGGVDEADVAAGVVSRELRLGVGRAAEPVRQAGYGQGHQRLVGA
jgi:hypothetical protein